MYYPTDSPDGWPDARKGERVLYLSVVCTIQDKDRQVGQSVYIYIQISTYQYRISIQDRQRYTVGKMDEQVESATAIQPPGS